MKALNVAVDLYTLSAAGLPADASPEVRIQHLLQCLQTVLGSPNRMIYDRDRDSVRQPLQIMQFLDVRPEDRILDFSSWDGYWATMMVPLTKLPVWCQNVTFWKGWSEPVVQRRLAMADKSQNPNGSNPYGPLRFFYSNYDDPTPPVPPMCKDPNCSGCQAEWGGWDAMFDVIFTFTNYHDSRAELMGSESVPFIQRAFQLLRPGGRLIVVDHAAVDGSGVQACKPLHRIDEGFVVQEVTSVGFELVDANNCLRMPEDNRLTPAFTGSNVRQNTRTDRFILKFVKPDGGPDRAALQCMLGHW